MTQPMVTRTRASRADAANTTDCAVVGAGPAGLTAALALAHVGARVVVAGPPFAPDPQRPDTRTTAIFSGGIRLLEALGVWQHCADQAAPLAAIRIIDDSRRLLRAPETIFRAAEIGQPAFGYNIANKVLVAALHKVIAGSAATTYHETLAATGIAQEPDRAVLNLQEGASLPAALIVGADGRASMSREAAGIAPISWDYDQAAIACNFEHSRSHQNISNEFHRAAGPFTTVPLPGNKSSLVWVETKAEAARLKSLDDEAFAAAIEERSSNLLGDVQAVGPRAHFPLSGMAARSLAQNRIALIGEAAHVVPPIGAQGLNLGFRDAAALAECVGDALTAGGDPGGPATLAAYRRARRTDVLSRTLAVDLLNRTLLSGLLPAQALRGAGLHALNAIGPLRRFVMREGLQPGGALPRLMR